VGTWTKTYKEFLDTLCEADEKKSKDAKKEAKKAETASATSAKSDKEVEPCGLKGFDDLYNDVDVRFILYFTEEGYDAIKENPAKFEKQFKLITTWKTTNMTCFDTEFNIEVKIDEVDNIEGFELDGGYYDDEDTFEIQIIYNPKFFPENYYDLIGELNELVRHELQHLIQAERGIDRPTDETDPEKYYLQPHEIDAQVAGFKRLSKIRKQPFEKIVRDFFHKNKTLSDEAKERIVSKILIAKR
jgi:hypothetical protein